MADTKISALPSATTPLAGTETLPVVQSSATKKVSVANLTAGRAVSALSFTANNTGFATPVANFESGDQSGARVAIVNSGAGGQTFHLVTGNPGVSNSGFALYDNTNSATRLYVGSSTGDLTLNTGNLIQGTAAKGVNFTANTSAAGMTSQLLNWYEEGLITVTATPDTGTITLKSTDNKLRYTRMGRAVHISGTLVVNSVSSPTGNVYFGTLPFTCGFACGGGIAIDGTNTFTGDVGYFINASQSVMYAYYRDTSGNYATSASIFKADTVIRIDTTYTV